MLPAGLHSYTNFPLQTFFNPNLMRTHFLSLLAAAILFFAACKTHDASLTDTNATGEIPNLGNLVFRFSKPLVPDSLTGRWDSLDYVHFEPAIKGRFRWEHPDELVFSPASPLAPATSYKATLGKELLAHNEFDNVTSAKPIEFHTPALKLENSNITWVLSEGKAVPQDDREGKQPFECSHGKW